MSAPLINPKWLQQFQAGRTLRRFGERPWTESGSSSAPIVTDTVIRAPKSTERNKNPELQSTAFWCLALKQGLVHASAVEAIEQSNLSAPVTWFAELATGHLAVIAATICVAAIGVSTLDGRLDWRSAIRVLLGCFLLFGAPIISTALLNLNNDASPLPIVEQRVQAPTEPSMPIDDPWAVAAFRQAPLNPAPAPPRP